ncbi:hypothetical protein ACFQPA_15525 [Halomarina halobia]|uniref:hypothetical protein n=1 Tax=Halomarina halobia TaxID=3033386 RepID=UPI0023E84325|nr:hypothetical protein [Halomarina sp. PSR21]
MLLIRMPTTTVPRGGDGERDEELSGPDDEERERPPERDARGRNAPVGGAQRDGPGHPQSLDGLDVGHVPLRGDDRPPGARANGQRRRPALADQALPGQVLGRAERAVRGRVGQPLDARVRGDADDRHPLARVEPRRREREGRPVPGRTVELGDEARLVLVGERDGLGTHARQHYHRRHEERHRHGDDDDGEPIPPRPSDEEFPAVAHVPLPRI